MTQKKRFSADWTQPIAAPLSSSGGARSRKSPLTHDYADADILRLSAFFRDNPVPILVFNPDGEVIKINPASERLLKRLNLQPSDLLCPEHLEIVQLSLKNPLKDYTVEVTSGKASFVLFYHALTVFKLVYMYAIDLTDEYTNEEEFRHLTRQTLSMVKQALLQLQEFRYWQQLNFVAPERQ